MKTFMKFISVVGILLVVLGTRSISVFADDPVENKAVENKAEKEVEKKKADIDIDVILHKKKPKAKIMEIFIDYERERLIYWGRLFEETKEGMEKKKDPYITRNKYDFVVDGHNGKILYWMEYRYYFPIQEKTDRTQAMIGKEKVKEIALKSAPESTINTIEWDMIDQLVYYDATITKKDKTVVRLAIDAYTGEIVDNVNNIEQKTDEKVLTEVEKKELEKQQLRASCIAESKIAQFLLGKIPGADIVNQQLDLDVYPPVYKGSLVHNNKVYRYQINALTGSLEQWTLKTYHEPIYVHRGERTVSRPIPPTGPIIQIPMAPMSPTTPIIPTPPQWLTPPNAPRIPTTPRAPKIPNPPAIPMPRF